MFGLIVERRVSFSFLAFIQYLVVCRLSSFILILCLSLCLFNISYAGVLTISVVDNRGRPVPDTVVYLETKLVSMTVRPKRTEIAQQDKTFIPFVSVVQVGTPIFFPNKDKVQHHVYSFSSTKKFELKLYAGTPSTPIVFEQAGTAVLGCNIHDSMLAYVYVVDTPLFGKTDEQGVFQFKDLVNSEYTIKVWQYQKPYELALKAQTIVVKDESNLKLTLPYSFKEWEQPKTSSSSY